MDTPTPGNVQLRHPTGITKVQDGEGDTMVAYNDVGFIDMPPISNLEEKMAQMSDFKCRSDDVFVCSFPKSGTHLVWTITSMLVDSSQYPSYPERALDDALLEFEGPSALTSNLPPPRVMASHLGVVKMPPSVLSSAKIVVVYRNPKDAYVSFYHQLRGLKWREYSGTWSGFFELMMQRNEQHLGGPESFISWVDHTKGWWEFAKKNSNVTFVRYEDLVSDPIPTIKRISDFLDLQREAATLEHIAMKCKFDSMKKARDDKDGWDQENWKDTSAGIYRKGKIGDWKNLLTVAQNERFDSLIKRRFSQTGFSLT
ncbi:sulfotransferase 1C2 [Lingula anatina]|uniref:Sulfotransferase 1C2 n=1 Tax=Lingula anatina TaxID=7574 RepID=A0A1S3KAT1_LINAN|nr:sulfotransferase 1C2 [Lingula anatina]|eukprot:XP_013419597.1 sulfotransferase 1C2 [Lingula anatina]